MLSWTARPWVITHLESQNTRFLHFRMDRQFLNEELELDGRDILEIFTGQGSDLASVSGTHAEAEVQLGGDRKDDQCADRPRGMSN